MAVIIKVPGVDWSSRGFPNIYPFVARNELEFGFDLANRAGRFEDISGNVDPMVPYRNDTDAGIEQQDESVVVDIFGGLGARLEMGYLDTDIALEPIPLDGSRQFTLMVVGGYDGSEFPADKIPDGQSAPIICSMFDYGTGINNSDGFAVEYYNGQLGLRVENGSPSLWETISPTLSVIFVTFDGSAWTFNNLTTGYSESKTNAELGIAADPIPTNPSFQSAKIGKFSPPSNVINGLFPSVFQFAQWDRVLTSGEILDQYSRTKMAKPGIGL